jgi:digeranylgeranylglycerophospholipid reductase
MEDHYDIIVAGAGLSGTLAAAAAAKKGMKVLLLDKNKESEPGKKTNWGWVCGDAVADSHVQFIKKKLGIDFTKEELGQPVTGVVALSPDLKSRFMFDGKGYVLERPKFEAKLLSFAKKSGAHFISEFDVENPIIENDYVVGVSGKDKSMKHMEFRAKVVIDCLGVATNLRRKLPDNPYIDKMVNIDDMESTGRYIYDTEIEKEDLNYYDPNIALIHLNQVLAPGGYGWVFPKAGGKNRINIGIGTQKSSIEARNKALGKKDTLHSLMDEYVKSIPIIKSVTLDNSDNNGKGYWSVAVRRQMESLVYNGYMGAGDSMAMPNPISAGGIGPALISGVISGEHAANAVKAGDVSMKALWPYNLEFNELYGKKTACMEAFRTYMQSLNNELLNYGMKNFLTSKEAQDVAYGMTPELSSMSKLKMAAKVLSNVGAFMDLVWVINKMKKLNAIYENYPKSPEDNFVEWKNSVKREIEETQAKFKPHPI